MGEEYSGITRAGRIAFERTPGSLSHRMGEGQGEGQRVNCTFETVCSERRASAVTQDNGALPSRRYAR